MLSFGTGVEGTNWHSEASLIYNIKNYPRLNNNEKALMLAKKMDEAGESFQVIRTYYKIEGISIHKDGMRVFPPYESKTKYDDMEIIGKDMIVYDKNENRIK